MRLSRLLRKLGVWRRDAAGDHRESVSLFGEILDWMLAPLLLLWPISILLTHDVASQLANQPYDQLLAEQVHTLSRQVSVGSNGQVRTDLTRLASSLMRPDVEDQVWFQIVGADGRLLAGEADLPEPPRPARQRDNISFHDAELRGEEVRIAALRLDAAQMPRGGVLVQVAETRNKRRNLSSRIVSGILLPQFAIIPLAVILVWFGLSRGIAPLAKLQDLIRSRRPGDLSPVATQVAPEEVRPLIVAFNDMMERLDRLLHAQQHFIADAAHQMRTPIAGLKMQIELAAHEPDPQQQRAAVARALQGADRAARLINQLLSLARADASSENVHDFREVDLAARVRESVSAFVPLALSKGLDLGVEAPAGAVRVMGNEVLLAELIDNLVDNAVKYTPAGGQVTVLVTPLDDGACELCVRDDGPGIPAAERQRVFQRFYRVLGNGAEGSGLGLAIVHEVAELHAANVDLGKPTEMRGLEVRVRFPPWAGAG